MLLSVRKLNNSVLQNLTPVVVKQIGQQLLALKPRTFVEDCLEQHASKNKEAKEPSTLEHTSSSQLNDGNYSLPLIKVNWRRKLSHEGY